MMEKEEVFILSSPEKRRILIDFYETNLSNIVMEKIVQHIERLRPKIIKLAIASDKKSLRLLRKSMNRAKAIDKGLLYFSTDMEDGKTWLVSDNFIN